MSAKNTDPLVVGFWIEIWFIRICNGGISDEFLQILRREQFCSELQCAFPSYPLVGIKTDMIKWFLAASRDLAFAHACAKRDIVFDWFAVILLYKRVAFNILEP